MTVTALDDSVSADRSRPKHRLRTEIIDARMLARGYRYKRQHAEIFGIPATYYHDLRSGRRPIPLSVALQIADETWLSVEQIIERVA